MKTSRILFLLTILSLNQAVLSFVSQTSPVPLAVVEPVDCSLPMPPPPPGGPSQPEVQSFTPADVSNMVNLFTGDVNYNINLLDIGGYPVNISYSQDIGMESEASSVGLGWNLSIGVINRVVRGLPDDFLGENIRYEQFEKPREYGGAGLDLNAEFWGIDESYFGVGVGTSLFCNYNNYTGVTVGSSISPSLLIGKSLKDAHKGKLGATLGLNSDDGWYMCPAATYMYGSDNHSFSATLGCKYSSFEGMESINFGAKYTYKAYLSGPAPNSKNRRASMNTGSGLNLNHTFNQSCVYVPFRKNPMSSWSVSGKFSMGGELTGLYLGAGISGFYSKRYLSTNAHNSPAYGYLFSHKSGDGDVVLDFRRDEETSIDNKVPVLPATAFTYDLFQVSGQGLDAQFRAHRTDVGILHDPYTQTGPGPDIGLGGEVGLGKTAKLGIDIDVNLAFCESGKWKDGNAINGSFGFSNEEQPWVFKQTGELSVFDSRLYDQTGQEEPVKFAVSDGEIHKTLLAKDDRPIQIPNPSYRNPVSRPSLLFTTLNALEATVSGLEKTIKSTRLDGTSGSPLPRVDEEYHRENHISEVTVTKEDGVRYVYGIPAYNTSKQEVSFNISGCSPSPGSPDGLITYVGTHKDYRKKSCGLNRSYSSTSTPGYAYAYWLTAIVSPDYVDRIGDGPTHDDNGTYTKFNYARHSKSYRWRMPYTKNSAYYAPNTENLSGGTEGDDVASFSYGEKEIWYPQSIETKNYYAQFYYSARLDGKGVMGADGGISGEDDQTMMKLDSIALFARNNYELPIKTVHFTYDYSLCKGVPSNLNSYTAGNRGNSGKLTLKEIYFTYGYSSKKGAFAKHRFQYSDVNPDYKYSMNDRWGNFSESKGEFTELEKKDFPYVQQVSKATADREARAWLLEKIETPSGGTIQIAYESDDYAYVQDIPAMQMVKVLGFGNEPSDVNMMSSILSYSRLDYDHHKKVIFFKIPQRPAGSLTPGTLLRRMINGVNELYFNMNVKIALKNENINGFIKLEENPVFGVHYGSATRTGETEPDVGWIKFDYSHEFHPVARSAFRFAEENLPRIAKGQTGRLPDGDPGRFFTEYFDRVVDMYAMWASASRETFMFNQYIGNQVEASQSYIRLNNPYKQKFGGGARVKQITVSDNWTDAAHRDGRQYGVQYDYSTLDETGQRISSGVCSYEPEVGNDENPLYQPLRIRDYDDAKYRRVTLPFGRGLMPAPLVGYAKVTVTSLQDSDIRRNATGKTVHEFYTSLDFPFRINSTTPTMLNNFDGEGEQVVNFLKSTWHNEQRLTVSQGYAVVLNDMHGKPKSVRVFQEGNETIPLSGTTYLYKTIEGDAKRLSNELDFIAPAGTVSQGMGGISYDFVIDSRYSKDEVWRPRIEAGLDLAIFPVFGISLIPLLSYNATVVHLLSTTKVIYQTGLLDRIVAFDNGASVTTRNLAYDSETGQSLITETANEFLDAYYTLNVPAYWVEPAMGPAAYNAGREARITEYAGGVGLTIPSAGDIFQKGDEIHIVSKENAIATIQPATDAGRFWVLSVTGNKVRIIDENGEPPLLSLEEGKVHTAKVLRSGRRNMQSLPAGSITTQTAPVTGGRLTDNWTKVVNAQALEYSDHWQTYNLQRTSNTAGCYCADNQAGKDLIENILNDIKATNRTFDIAHYTSTAPWTSSDEKIGRMGHGSVVLSRVPDRRTSSTIITLNEVCTLELYGTPGANLLGTLAGERIEIRPIPGNNGICRDDYEFEATLHFSSGDSSQGIDHSLTVRGFCRCIPLTNCHPPVASYSQSDCNVEVNVGVNPFVTGVLGNYRLVSEYVYKGKRTGDGHMSMRESGFYDNGFSPFWNCAAFSRSHPNPDKWTTAATVTKTDPNGRIIETKDALGIPSAGLYGFNKNFPVASAQNATYSQIAFESFEDHEYPIGVAPGGCPDLKHWPVFTGLSASESDLDKGIVSDISHTGRNSFFLEAGLSHPINVSLAPVSRREGRPPYGLKEEEIAGRFKPVPGEYFISGWIRMAGFEGNISAYTEYEGAKISVCAGAECTWQVLDRRTNIIDGWQQVSGTFTIPEDAETVVVRLTAGRKITWFDDLRIQPVDAVMKTYAYDPKTLRLSAELDENNFATLFEYDEEGALVRKKKETERGVMTLEEIRFSNSKTAPR